jgi:hypothetical protein
MPTAKRVSGVQFAGDPLVDVPLKAFPPGCQWSPPVRVLSRLIGVVPKRGRW